jgi:hypothetical protein
MVASSSTKNREAEPESWDELQNMSPGEVRIFFGPSKAKMSKKS